MKRRIWLYVLGSISVAVSVAVSIVGFVLDVLAASILGPIVAAFALFWLATVIAQDNLNIRCGRLCGEKKYEEERALIEKKMKSPFFFLIRTVALTRYIRVCMALDDLNTAKRYIDSLRHGGGSGWKYMTAFFFILIKLDEGDGKTAFSEFEEFRTQCAHAEIYREEIVILTAIFERLLKGGSTQPLPVEAVETPFPVVRRILGKHYEAQEWEN